MQIKTWGDLRDFLNTLTDEQLSARPVVINAPEETTIYIGEAEVSETTYFYNEDSEGLIPVEDYGDPEDWDGHTLDDSEYNTIVPPGKVFVYEEDFS